MSPNSPILSIPSSTKMSNVPRNSLPAYVPSQAENDGINNRNMLCTVNEFLAIMLALFIQMKTGSPTTPVTFNHYDDILKIQDWLTKQPLLFRASQKDAADALNWAMDLRLSISHNWTNRMMIHRQHHLSAVVLLAGDAMINDPFTKKFATDLLVNQLGLIPLTSLPSVPKRPK